MQNKLKHEGIALKDLKHFKKPDFASLMKSAVDLSDGVIRASFPINAELDEYIAQSGKKLLQHPDNDSYIDSYNEFYESIIHN